MRNLLLPVVLAGFAAGCAGRAQPALPVPLGVPADVHGSGLVARGDVPVVASADTVADAASDAAQALPDGVDPADFDIALQYNDRVGYWLDVFQRAHDTFAGWLTDMARYEPFIRERLAAAGLPQDLIYLALIESGFTPGAVSSARAVGIWQFMAGTARMEGLEVSAYVDERRDPFRSTDAAAKYLRALYDEFGSWYLAAAAYNSGDSRVQRALDELAGGARGQDSLFWTIESALPRETRNYVPELIAASILAKYPDRYGFGSLDKPSPEHFDVVSVRDATDLAAVARASDSPLDVVRRLNPQYYRDVTPPGRTVQVRVPAGHADCFAKALAAIPARERVHDVEHVVAKGETAKSVAADFGVSLADLRRANHLRRKKEPRAGTKLTIPLLPPTRVAEAADGDDGAHTSATRKAAPDERAGARTYRVRHGDTLWGIARDNGLTVAELRDLNDLGEDDVIQSGQELVVSRARVIVYEVRSGDTLSEIAEKHGIPTRTLLEWNDLAPDSIIQPGDRVEVPVSARQ